jgi:hypothetical protein
MSAINSAATTRQQQARAGVHAVHSMLALYKGDTNVIPMIPPTLSAKERNRLLVRALTNPTCGWKNAARGQLVEFLRTDSSDGQEYLLDSWGNLFEYYSFKFEGPAYRKVYTVKASWVTVTFKVWNQANNPIGGLVILMPYDEGLALEQYVQEDVLEAGTDHGVARRPASATYPYVLSRSRYYQLLDMATNLISRTTSLKTVQVRGWLPTAIDPAHDEWSVSAPRLSDEVQEVYCAYFYSPGQDGRAPVVPLAWKSATDPNSRDYALFNTDVNGDGVSDVADVERWPPAPRLDMESENKDNIGAELPVFRYTGRRWPRR